MKIALASDVHLEFGPLEIKNTEAADLLVLAGDICVAHHFKSQDKFVKRYLEFFKQCSEEFPVVLYVVGNHEHYHNDFAYTVIQLREALESFTNIHILDNETYVLDDITFVGGTLWTDMNNRDDITIGHMKMMMNDFQCIRNSDKPTYRTVPLYDDGEYNVDRKVIGHKQKAEPSKFSPRDSVEEHDKMLDYINAVVSERANDKFVVIGHHGPSRKSIHEKFAHDTIMNGAFVSSLDDFIAYRPQIKLWLHGHTHSAFDYTIGETRVVCNPRGYINYEHFADYFQLKYLDV
jgi:Icc-related predicted phosphoesterase